MRGLLGKFESIPGHRKTSFGRDRCNKCFRRSLGNLCPGRRNTQADCGKLGLCDATPRITLAAQFDWDLYAQGAFAAAKACIWAGTHDVFCFKR